MTQETEHHNVAKEPSVPTDITPEEILAKIKTLVGDEPAPTIAQNNAEKSTPQQSSREVVTTWLELHGFWRIFTMSEWIMRDRTSFFEEVRTRHDLTVKLQSMVLSSLVYLALYGLSLIHI